MQSARSLSVLAAAAIAADDTQWIEVIPTAKEARNGAWFFTITRDDLDVYAESIRNQPGLIPIDYDHQGGVGGSTVAAGWFTGDTDIVDVDGVNPAGETQQYASLWAKAKWTPQGAQDVRDGNYKRISPEFTFHERDQKKGLLTKAKEILAATLTNRPFFSQMAPVGSRGDVVWDAQQAFSYLQDRINASLNGSLPGEWNYWVCDVMPGAALIRENSTSKSWVAAFELASNGGVTVSPPSMWIEAKQEWVQAAEAALESGRRPSTRKDQDMDTKVLATSLGLPEDATEEQITEAVKAAKTKADETDTVTAELADLKKTGGDKTEIEQLRADLNAEKTLRITEKRDAILAKAVEDRRIDPATKAVLADQFGDNIDGLEKILATFTPKLVGARGGGGGTKEGGAGADEIVRAAEDFEITDDFKTVAAGDGELELHVRAVKILADRGKHDYTSEEYMAAYIEAERTPVAA